MIKRVFLCVVLTLCCMGCLPKATTVSRESLGKVVIVKLHPATPSQEAFTVVECEKGAFTLKGMRSIKLNQGATLVHQSDGYTWATWDSATRRYLTFSGTMFGRCDLSH